MYQFLSLSSISLWRISIFFPKIIRNSTFSENKVWNVPFWITYFWSFFWWNYQVTFLLFKLVNSQSMNHWNWAGSGVPGREWGRPRTAIFGNFLNVRGRERRRKIERGWKIEFWWYWLGKTLNQSESRIYLAVVSNLEWLHLLQFLVLNPLFCLP